MHAALNFFTTISLCSVALASAIPHKRNLTTPSVPRACTPEHVSIRKNWDTLTPESKKSYISAIKCMQSLPSITPNDLAPGARNRLDDFTIAHMNQTLVIHFTGWLLPWHRYFLHLYETALRDECGYEGYQPYWDWLAHADDITKYPLLDGSELSFGSNGAYVPHGTLNGTIPGVPDPQVITVPPGSGGGCVTDGPWGGEFLLNLGPVFPAGSQVLSYEYQPHCMTRDFQQGAADTFTQAYVDELLGQSDIASFQNMMDANFHSKGHGVVGGDVVDVFTSPNDPVFYFHHTALDRLWYLWQEGDKEERVGEVAFTTTWANSPPSANATLDDVLDFGFIGGKVKMRDVVDTVNGPLCYRYE